VSFGDRPFFTTTPFLFVIPSAARNLLCAFRVPQI
jgi:hypothetical protein